MKTYIPSMLKLLAIPVVLTFSLSTSAMAGDSHAGYYYPEPATSEVYVSPLSPLASTSKRTRVGFTVGLSKQQLSRSFAPHYHIFAKGAQAQKLIIVSTGGDRYNTLYRLRALLAGLTAEARNSPLFSQARNPEEMNFFDLARLVGFTQITVSDGNQLSHRINLLGAN